MRAGLPGVRFFFAGAAMDVNSAWYLMCFAWGLVCAWAVIKGLGG